MKEYRVKHKPTGLYYQPVSRSGNLSKGGKVYFGKGNVLTYNKRQDWIGIGLNPKTTYYRQYKAYFDSLETIGFYFYKVPKSHFEIEEL